MSEGLIALLRVAVGFVLFTAALVRLDRIMDKRSERLIPIAQEMELGEGVTLLQGVRAYLGDDGYWQAKGNMVLLSRSVPQANLRSPLLRIHPKKWRLEIPIMGSRTYWPDLDDPNELIEVLIRAAKAQQAASEE